MAEPVEAAVARSRLLGGDQRLEVGRVFDLLAMAIAPRVCGHDRGAFENPHVLGAGDHDEGAADAGMGHRIVIAVEAGVRGLADLYGLALLGRILRRGEGQQDVALFGKGLLDRQGRLLGAAAFGGQAVTPGGGLIVEIVKARPAPGSEEGVADVLDGALDPALFVAARHGDGPWLETVVPGKLEQRWMQADGVAASFKHSTLEVVVEHDPGHPSPGGESGLMAAAKSFRAGLAGKRRGRSVATSSAP